MIYAEKVTRLWQCLNHLWKIDLFSIVYDWALGPMTANYSYLSESSEKKDAETLPSN